MKLRYMIALLLGGVLLLVLSGCYGNSPVLDPQISFTLPDLPADTTTITSYVPTIPANGYLQIKGTLTNPTADNVITNQQWTQQAVTAGAPLGHFFVTDSLETSWQAPDWKGPGNAEYTLTFTVDTSLGGHTVKSLHVVVTP